MTYSGCTTYAVAQHTTVARHKTVAQHTTVARHTVVAQHTTVARHATVSCHTLVARHTSGCMTYMPVAQHTWWLHDIHSDYTTYIVVAQQ